MIPGPFEYHRPASLADAIGLLADPPGDSRVLAGGHSLIPMMKLRMATPARLIDLGRIAELRSIAEADGHIVIGAGVTQGAMIASDLLAHRLPILREAALQIADPQIRAKGTLGGNVANGDPGNDMPAVMQCLDAVFVLHGPRGERLVRARAFYLGIFETALQRDEVMTAIRVPAPPQGHGACYEKLKRKVGDYATAAAAVTLTLDAGRIASVAIALTNVGPTPLLAQEAMTLLAGAVPDQANIRRAAAAAKAIADPATVGRGTAEYRREMAGVMVARALTKAAARAGQGG